MKVHILTKVIGNHTEIINTYADEEKAWDYVEKEAEKHGDKVYVKAYGEGFKEEDMTVHIDNEFVTYCVSLKLDKI